MRKCIAATQLRTDRGGLNLPSRFVALVLYLVLAAHVDAVGIEMRTSTGAICLPVSIEGRQFWFQIDTGIGISVIDPALSKSLHLRATGETRSVENVPAGMVQARATLGRTDLGVRNFAVTNILLMGQFVRGTKEKIRGCIGADVLRGVTLGLNFGKCKAWVTRDASVQGFEGMDLPEIPENLLARIEFDNFSRPFVRATIFGRSVRALVDLGSRFSFLSSDDWRKVSTRLVAAGTTHLTRPRGPVSTRTAIVSEIRVRDVVWENVPVTEQRDPSLTGLGWTAFAPFTAVILDFKNCAVYVAKPRTRISGLDCALSLYGLRINGRYLLGQSYQIPLTSLKSFFGIPIRHGHPLDQRWAWNPRNIGAGKILDLYYPSRSKTEYIYRRRLCTTYFSLVEPAVPKG